MRACITYRGDPWRNVSAENETTVFGRKMGEGRAGTRPAIIGAREKGAWRRGESSSLVEPIRGNLPRSTNKTQLSELTTET